MICDDDAVITGSFVGCDQLLCRHPAAFADMGSVKVRLDFVHRVILHPSMRTIIDQQQICTAHSLKIYRKCFRKDYIICTRLCQLFYIYRV